MRDADCTAFLQWALPQLDLRWAGFRKVRHQVCKRIRHRIGALDLADLAAYRERLQADPQEWRALDACCRVTISRFFRDRHVFDVLRREVLPAIALRAQREARAARCWSAGCASGEEPYTIRILWDLDTARACPGATLSIVATDIDEAVLSRARGGCFERASLRELPVPLIEQAFERDDGNFRVRPEHRGGIEFVRQDLRLEMPPGQFDLVLCRYLAFTYFSPQLQGQMLARIAERLAPGGHLVIGSHERLPDGRQWLKPVPAVPQIFVK